METNTGTTQKKPGRKPQGLSKHQAHILLPEELKAWLDQHPEGTSPLLRRLLREEYERQRRQATTS